MPPKLAVKLCVPLARTPTSRLAAPVASVSAVPKIDPLSRKVTVPDGARVCAFTLATRIELLVAGSNFCKSEITDLTALAGGAVTLIETGAEVLPANGPLALKLAVIVCAPVLRDAVLNATLPLAVSPNVPRMAFPS